MIQKYFIVGILAFLLAGCGSTTGDVARPASNGNLPAETAHEQKSRSTLDHTTENQTPRPVNAGPSDGSKWSASGDPIDTAKFDGTIAAAAKNFKDNPSDEAAKKALADAYFDRGFALTEARQYASAMGDYRRAVKLDPNHEESKKWLEQIASIYKMLKKDPPKEGEEPPPLPFKKS